MLNNDWKPLLKSAMKTHKYYAEKDFSYKSIMNPNYCISFWSTGITYMSQIVRESTVHTGKPMTRI